MTTTSSLRYEIQVRAFDGSDKWSLSHWVRVPDDPADIETWKREYWRISRKYRNNTYRLVVFTETVTRTVTEEVVSVEPPGIPVYAAEVRLDPDQGQLLVKIPGFSIMDIPLDYPYTRRLEDYCKKTVSS